MLQQASEEDEGENEQAQPEVQAPPVADAQLLLLHSNCVYVRTTVMAHLIARFVNSCIILNRRKVPTPRHMLCMQHAPKTSQGSDEGPHNVKQ